VGAQVLHRDADVLQRHPRVHQTFDRTGRFYGFVHQRLADAEVTLPDRGGNTRRKDR
jgi:hypothetical protein